MGKTEARFVLRGHVRKAIGLTLALVTACGHAQRPVQPGSVVARLAADAPRLYGLCPSPWVRRFLDGARALPAVTPRQLVVGDRTLIADESLYYEELYGSPLAYCRALELAGLDDVAGTRVLDYGYGAIGQLRILAGLGADVVGVDVDPLLAQLYAHPASAQRSATATT